MINIDEEVGKLKKYLIIAKDEITSDLETIDLSTAEKFYKWRVQAVDSINDVLDELYNIEQDWTENTIDKSEQSILKSLKGTIPKPSGYSAIIAENAIKRLNNSFLFSIENVKRNIDNSLLTVHHLNDKVLSSIGDTIITGDLSGKSLTKIERDIAQQLKDNGLVSMVKSNGAKITLDDYSDVLARSELSQFYNDTMITECLTYGIDIIEWYTVERSCSICSPRDGRLYSLTGKSKNYPALDIGIPAHPRCDCGYKPRPDLN